MRINDIIISIHGERPFMGKPCTILRLSGCNLSCPYCDTKHHNVIQESTPAEIFAQLKELGIYNVLLTGGEPLLQGDEVFELLSLMRSEMNSRRFEGPNWLMVIETNGTIDLGRIREEFPGEACIVMDLKDSSCIDGEQLTTSMTNIYMEYPDVIKMIFNRRTIDFYKSILESEDFKVEIPVTISLDFNAVLDHPFISDVVEYIIDLQKRKPNLNLYLQLQLHKILNIA